MDNTWILFSDDDDEWHESRLSAYHYMINDIPSQDLEYTSCVCYTHTEPKNSEKYIGSYTDYAVKLKFVKKFFEATNHKHWQHKFCDCFFVKFICTYGNGVLKRAFCSTPEILYHWIKNNSLSTTTSNLDLNQDYLDLYMAQYSNNNTRDWLVFFETYYLKSDPESKPTQSLTLDKKRDLIKFFLDNYTQSIFNDSIIPKFEN